MTTAGWSNDIGRGVGQADRMSHLLVGKQGANGVAHAALCDHVPRPPRGLPQIAARAGCHLLAGSHQSFPHALTRPCAHQRLTCHSASEPGHSSFAHILAQQHGILLHLLQRAYVRAMCCGCKNNVRSRACQALFDETAPLSLLAIVMDELDGRAVV